MTAADVVLYGLAYIAAPFIVGAAVGFGACWVADKLH
jgi:hypothetical protein